jgi:hypothetical protein
MRRVLVVWHSRTGLARAMADALEEGASLAATGMESELTLVRRAAGEATVEDLLSSDGYLFCAPENLAMVSGEMAEFFQRVYYHVFDTHESSSGYGESSRLLGRPCALGRWQLGTRTMISGWLLPHTATLSAKQLTSARYLACESQMDSPLLPDPTEPVRHDRLHASARAGG